MTVDPSRTITENRDEEADLNSRQAVVAAERVAQGDARKVLEPYFPRDLPSGSPASESGTLISFNELDDDLKALIGGAGGSGSATPFREYDITAGPAIGAGDPLDILTGLFTGAGARTSLISQLGIPRFPTTGSAFQVDSRIDIWLNGQHMSLGPDAGTPRDLYWVDETKIAFATALKGGNTILVRAPASY